jgi:hypothetical protein
MCPSGGIQGLLTILTLSIDGRDVVVDGLDVVQRYESAARRRGLMVWWSLSEIREGRGFARKPGIRLGLTRYAALGSRQMCITPYV